ncbi:pectin lyase-like protein [Aspergillus egyptiacus]|nr:pectin lyase-like protein [Aspergillus egyptiacus]
MNKGRLAHPQRNTYQFQSESTNAGTQAAPELNYEKAVSASDSVHGLSLDGTKHSKRSADDVTYTILPELAEAARVVAEAFPSPLPGDYGVDIPKEIGKYRLWRTNDTNMPEQKYRRPNGHTGHIDESTPAAPEGYKAWRNVKDYGAKGDGYTDDTAAINRAISDGGRCGESCGSSTIYPAFVYFPPGTYLVSSSIIQYYNTEFYGNPFDYPTILAASSFVGLGVITSDVYITDNIQWYLSTSNFLRSIRNFKIDITRTDPNAYVCGIHWQVAQGTSLENIEFYMMQDGQTTQQGVYMENGSGGFLTNLTFVGGNFGQAIPPSRAYFGNQQFTTSQLSFVNCKTALQIHWDWAWTMQDVVITNCVNGIVIVGGAGGSKSTGQSVGSLIVLDTVIAFTETAIVTSLFAENSTSFLLQNAQFISTETAVLDNVQGRTLLAGGSQVTVESWGFGRVATSSTNSVFYNGQEVPAMNRSSALTVDGYFKPNFFQRRRPTYSDIGMNQIIDVKAWGAVGDGQTDDAPVLNSILDRAANMSAIVFFPFGVYVIQDTLHVPVGSRIIGQAWSQIMAKGPNFQNELEPHVAVQVGKPGDIGIIEIQSMMFTVSGPTAGAVLVEWNVHESTQGSAAMWDSHFRVGGAIGSLMRSVQCPKTDGDASTNTNCKGASLLLHLTTKSSAYLENIWAWAADHDLDKKSLDQVDVYSARGILVESQGPTWMYGTSSEHNVLYQYQVSNAKDLYMSMIQTESPYFQPVPKAPSPFTTGLFPNDPVFTKCAASSDTCALSWALRIIDSNSVYVMGAGLYSWFSGYDQDCVDAGNCQERAVEISQSTDTWLYNLVTKGILEMVSPSNEEPTLATDNVNGYMSSVLAWVRGKAETIGERNFPGFRLHKAENLKGLTSTCTTALSQKILCHPYLYTMQTPGIGRFIENATLADEVCDLGCGQSLKGWYDNVASNCAGQTIGISKPTHVGGIVYANYNMTCLKDPATDRYCTDVVLDFTVVDDVSMMTKDEMCSPCFTSLLTMRQASPYAAYSERDKRSLEAVQAECGLVGPTDLHDSLYIEEPTPEPICLSDVTYTTRDGDTCDSIALEYSVASTAIIFGNPTRIASCSKIVGGMQLCIPLSCETLYTVADNDTCFSIERAHRFRPGVLRKYNSWLCSDCTNLQRTRHNLGSILCLSPQGGKHSAAGDSLTTTPGSGGYAQGTLPPPEDASVAPETTMRCGRWYTAVAGDSCVSICLQQSIPATLFQNANPSLSGGDCDASLVEGVTYCVAPHTHWDDDSFWA